MAVEGPGVIHRGANWTGPDRVKSRAKSGSGLAVRWGGHVAAL